MNKYFTFARSSGLLPIAKIQYRLPNESYRVNFHGDALGEIFLPAMVFICPNDIFHYENKKKSPQFTNIKMQKSTNFKKEIIYLADLLAIERAKKKQAHIRLSFPSHLYSFAEEKNTSLFSSFPKLDKQFCFLNHDKASEYRYAYEQRWICVYIDYLRQQKKKDELYMFQLLGLPVYSQEQKVGHVIDYFENGAHGVLVVQDMKKNKTMLPYVSKYTNLSPDLKYIDVPEYKAFC